MSDKWCTTCGLLVTACRCSQLDRCGECNGLIVEGFCDCDDVREDEDEESDEDGCDCVFCREDRGDEDDFDDNIYDDDICYDPDCDICS